MLGLDPAKSSHFPKDASGGGSWLSPSTTQHKDTAISENLFPIGQFPVILAHSLSRDEEIVLNLPPHQLCSWLPMPLSFIITNKHHNDIYKLPLSTEAQI